MKSEYVLILEKISIYDACVRIQVEFDHEVS